MIPLVTTPPTWESRATLYKGGHWNGVVGLGLAGLVPAPWVYNATVIPDVGREVGVRDADTINVDVDWGFRRHDVPVPIRLLGTNSRELAMPGGVEARDYVRALLPAGSPVTLMSAKPDKYAPRWDAVVLFRLRGMVVDLGAHLVTEGWAAPWDGKGSPAPIPPWPRPAPLP